MTEITQADQDAARNVIHRTASNPYYKHGEPFEETFIPVKVDNVDFENVDLDVDDDGACQCCGETKPVLMIGTSDGEYNTASLCADCARDLISREHLK